MSQTDADNFSQMAKADSIAKKKAISSDQMYAIEEKGHSGIGMKRVLMMENAGHGLADFIVSKFKGNIVRKKIVAICGTGNNGGDGFVASRHLAGYGSRPTIIMLGSPTDLRSEEARINWSIIEKMDSIDIIFGKELNDEIKSKILKADIIIDGIFGTGIKGELRDPHSSAIDLINKSKAYKVAVDIPSGLDPNTGLIHNKCVKADATVTFHRVKKGQTDRKSLKFIGTLHVEHIGIPPDAEEGIV